MRAGNFVQVNKIEKELKENTLRNQAALRL